MPVTLAKQSKDGAVQPFLKKDPKPTRARLVSLLGPLGRKRYAEIERYLATITGATSGLFYYGTAWGWAVRYQLGAKNTLCTLHLLPDLFEATVMLGKELDEPMKTPALSQDLKRKVLRGKIQSGQRCVRIPIKNDADFASFQLLIGLKSEALRAKKPAKVAAAKPEAVKKTTASAKKEVAAIK